MKKLLLALGAATFLFTACSKDDEDDNTPKNSELILGQWTLDQALITEFENGVIVNEDTATMALKVTFEASSFIAVIGTDTFDMGSYKLNGSDLDLYGTDTVEFSIKSLTKTNMHLMETDEYTIGTINHKDEFNYYFIK